MPGNKIAHGERLRGPVSRGIAKCHNPAHTGLDLVRNKKPPRQGPGHTRTRARSIVVFRSFRSVHVCLDVFGPPCTLADTFGGIGINRLSRYLDFSPRPFRNFGRPFTSQTWLGSARKFAKTCFRRFPTFHFSTPKKVFQRNFGSKI